MTETVRAETVAAHAAATRPPLPRIWTVFLTIACALVGANAVGGIGLIVAYMRAHPGADLRHVVLKGELTAAIAELLSSPEALFWMILPVQLAFLAITAAAVRLSPETLRTRTRLVRGGLDLRTLGLVLVGSLGVLFAAQCIGDWLFPEPSEQLRALSKLIVEARGPFAVALVAGVAIVPGFVEEFLFRGYVQSRLERRWPVRTAILVSAACFALAHGDPQHILLVFPIGVWLGFVASKLASTWASMIAHAFNNLAAIVMGWMVGLDENGIANTPPGFWIAAGVGVVLGAVAIFVLARDPSRVPGPLAIAQ